MPKSEKWSKRVKMASNQKLHEIKVVLDPAKWRARWGQIWPPRSLEAEIEVATMVGPILTKICMWCSYSMGSNMGDSIYFNGVPKIGAHFMLKTEKWLIRAEGGLQSKFFIKWKLFETHQNGGLDEVRSDLRGHWRPKSRLQLYVGPILTKIFMWCSFSVTGGGSIFFIGVPKTGAHFMHKPENCFFGQKEEASKSIY